MRPTTYTLLAILITILLVSWWLTNFERVTDEQFVGFSGEATYNRFYAAEQLLREAGLDADSEASLTPTTWLPDPVDTLVLPMTKPVLTGESSAFLQQWVIDGGHLVLLPYGEQEDMSGFLDYFGFELVRIDYDEEPDETGDSDSGETGEEDDKEVDYYIDLSSTYYRIEAQGDGVTDATLSDDEGMIAARRSFGDGVVTVVAASHYFNNYWLGEQDHARLFLDIVAGYYEPGKTWFIYSADFDALWELVWQSFPLAVTGFGLLLLAWLASILPRFGPRVSPPSEERRSMQEHIRAAGLFEWRNGDARQLAKLSAAAVLHEAETRHPGLKRLSPEKQARRLAGITGIASQDILDALIAHDDENARNFTQQLRTLQKTRDRL